MHRLIGGLARPQARLVRVARSLLQAHVVEPGVVVHGAAPHLRLVLEPPLAHHHILRRARARASRACLRAPAGACCQRPGGCTVLGAPGLPWPDMRSPSSRPGAYLLHGRWTRGSCCLRTSSRQICRCQQATSQYFFGGRPLPPRIRPHSVRRWTLCRCSVAQRSTPARPNSRPPQVRRAPRCPPGRRAASQRPQSACTPRPPAEPCMHMSAPGLRVRNGSRARISCKSCRDQVRRSNGSPSSAQEPCSGHTRRRAAVPLVPDAGALNAAHRLRSCLGSSCATRWWQPEGAAPARAGCGRARSGRSRARGPPPSPSPQTPQT